MHPDLEAMHALEAAKDAAANLVIGKLERGERPTEVELKAAGMCINCAGFGFVDYEDDGFTEIPCGQCKE